jgi:hypothetical protein
MAVVSVENYNSLVDNELDILMMNAAAIIIVRRRRPRLQHRRQLCTKSSLTERDTDRGISHFVSYELPDDASGCLPISVYASRRFPGAAERGDAHN